MIFWAGRSSGLVSSAAKAKTAVAKIATDSRARIFFIGCSFQGYVAARCCETDPDKITHFCMMKDYDGWLCVSMKKTMHGLQIVIMNVLRRRGFKAFRKI
jgi:hypothetical protein